MSAHMSLFLSFSGLDESFTMFRFLATVWDQYDQEANEIERSISERLHRRARLWRRVLECPGLSVSVSNECTGAHKIYPLGVSGVVLGMLFDQNSDLVSDKLPARRNLQLWEADAISAEGPGKLIELFWGWYVALKADEGKRGKWVFRGPMSDLACFHARVGPVTIIFSKADDLAELRALSFSVNWPLIQLRVGFGQPGLLGQSAIREISVLESGQALVFRDGSVETKTHWEPGKVARGDPIEDLAWCEFILRLHHPGEVWALDAFYDLYRARPAWPDLHHAIVDRCRSMLELCQRWEPVGIGVASWTERLATVKTWTQ